MATMIAMPKLGLTMNSGILQEWRKCVGELVKKGEILYVVATDKLTVDIESPADGVLLAAIIKEGEEVPVGTNLGAIGEIGEEIDIPAAETPQLKGPEIQPPTQNAARETAPGTRQAVGIAASPKAKKIAREAGIDIASIQGSGPKGWVVANDVLAVAAQEQKSVRVSPAAAKLAADKGVDLRAIGKAPGERIMKSDVFAAASPVSGSLTRRIPITQMRRIIGERMLQSVNTIPSVSYTVYADMTSLNALRSVCNERLEKKNIKVSINDIMMKLCAKLLMENPMFNASVEPEAFVLHGTVNIGLAVALREGLLVPNIKDVQTKNLTQIAEERALLVEKARGGKLSPDEMTGGTFTISNLGNMGVEIFSPIINPPEAAILGIGTTTERPVVKDGHIQALPMAALTLCADHRLVDGAEGAAFLARLKDIVECPGMFLL